MSRGQLVPARRDLTRPTPPPLPVRPVRAWLLGLLVPALPLSYLGTGEQVRHVTRLHWLAPARMLAKMSAMMLAIGAATWVAAHIAPGALLVQALLWGAAVMHSVMLGYRVLLWRAETIVVTDRRLYRVSGIVTISVDAVMLGEVTDVTYRQSLPGRLLGYGSLRFESAGQRQALQQLDHVPAPRAVYLAALGRLSAP